MAESKKPTSEYDSSQNIQKVFAKETGTLGVDGFIGGFLGRKIVRSVVNATTDNFAYSENGTALMTIQIVYTNAAHDDLVSVERIA